jgi:8-hydroxy-5-deazaflavin:NADPH oxidoreductase
MNLHRRRFIELSAFATSALLLGQSSDAADKKPKIGIIGAGKVGGALGTVWANAGYQVMFSSRNLDNDKALAAQVGKNASAGTSLEAAKFGDVLLFAVPYKALPDLGKELGKAIKGKIVIDACNPFAARDGDIATEALEKGAGITSAKLLPGAHIVRAFNAVGFKRMGEVHTDPGKVGMPLAGDDANAIKVASQLIRDIGFEPVLIGNLSMGKYLMPGQGQPLSGEHTPDEIRQIAATLK